MEYSDPERVLEHFRQTDALLEGHFVLSSGLHSDRYLQSALALQYPADAAKLGAEIARRTLAEEVRTVCSPAIGGLVIGYEVARALNVRFIWTERKGGKMDLRRGFRIAKGERILVVEDVITTGGSTRECIAAVEANGGSVVRAAAIFDRSGGKADVGVPLMSLVGLDVPVYEPEVCPLCVKGTAAEKPGSRV